MRLCVWGIERGNDTKNNGSANEHDSVAGADVNMVVVMAVMMATLRF